MGKKRPGLNLPIWAKKDSVSNVPNVLKEENMKLLLHTCCAPCSVYCIKKLREEGIEPTVYWFNPNIHPYIEYKARRDTLKEYTKSVRSKSYF